MALRLFPKTSPPCFHVNQSPHKGTVVVLDKGAAVTREKSRRQQGLFLKQHRLEGKGSQRCSLPPALRAMLELTVSIRGPAMQGGTGFVPQHHCPVHWCSTLVVAFLWRLTKPLLPGAQVPTVKLQVMQLTVLHLCCCESSGREERRGQTYCFYMH